MNEAIIGPGVGSSNWAVEECACPICGSTDADDTGYDQPPFKIKRCKSCRLWFLSPRLKEEEAQKFYQSENYFSGGDGESGYDDYSVQERSLRATFRKFIRSIDTRGATGGALLEVGCGPGYLLDEAKEYFGTVNGVELSENTANQAAHLTGQKIFLSIEEIDDALSFDCIVATHVIEHIYDPISFVESLAKRLKPDGSIVLAAPNMGSMFRKIMGRKWPSFKYPEHVCFFDNKTLPEIFTRVGLSKVERVPYPHVFPLSLVLTKFGVSGPRWTNSIDVTLPATTVCYMAKRAS